MLGKVFVYHLNNSSLSACFCKQSWTNTQPVLKQFFNQRWFVMVESGFSSLTLIVVKRGNANIMAHRRVGCRAWFSNAMFYTSHDKE